MKCFLQMGVGLGLLLLPCAVWAQGEALDQAEVMPEEVPSAVVASAVEAVGVLGDAVVQGRYHVALERMNPKWKERYAKRVGGMAVLEGKLKQVAAEMLKHGIAMITCKPQGQPQAFGVSPKQRDARQDGAVVKRLIYSQWLVLVPTVTRFKVQQQNGERLEIESTGFQVAVSDRDRLDWTFIDGAGITVNELRALFATLPQDLEFPPVGKRQTSD